MSRKSAASIEQSAKEIDAHKRPPPPASMDKEGAAEWHKVVDQLPPTWFPPETQAMLEDRCRHVVWNRYIATEIDAMIKKANGKGLDSRRYNSLVRAASYHSRIISMLDTKMRLTQQASYDGKKLKRSQQAAIKPWSA
jgi:hypothetical protein